MVHHPILSRPRTLLFIYAHPDDESFSGAGLTLKARSEGGRAVLVTATSGQMGKAGDPPLCTADELPRWRERELRTAAGIIGFDAVHLLGYEDRQLGAADPPAIRQELVALLRRHRPDVVVTFDPNGFNLHPDHVAISRFAMDAVAAAADPRFGPDEAWEVGRVLWTPIPAPWDVPRLAELEAEPSVDFVIDVSAWIRERAAALRAHRTQHVSIERCFFDRPDVDRILAVEVYRQAWGPSLGVRPQADVFDGL